ncbi:MAG: peptidoglycan-binding protein, partial [Verrucomicrobiota bacterium]|nr:peptidoglycan-binding protein [Verrucomicrobiota bacterium]
PYSAPARQFAGPSRSFSNSNARFNAPAHFSSAPSFQNRSYVAAGPRISPRTEFRNPTYIANRTRFSDNRTEAFNARTALQADARLAAGRIPRTHAQAFNSSREHVFTQRSANWRRNWDRSRDHWWNGRRCHFRNNVWVIYEPLFWYPSYGYYPYGSYYDSTYYDDSYASDQSKPATYTNQPDYYPGSRVSNVQSALAREGYYDGPIDGRLGNATQKALRRYQRDHGLEVTGGISRGVIEALRLR